MLDGAASFRRSRACKRHFVVVLPQFGDVFPILLAVLPFFDTLR